MITVNSLDDLLHDAINKVLTDGKKISATKGENKEVIQASFCLTDPLNRLSRSDSRGRVFSCLGELAWYLSGSDDIDFISSYISRYSKYAEPDGKVRGAYGPRLIDTQSGNNQIENVINLIKAKPTTRRAVIQLFDSADLDSNYNDIPCTLTVQFVLRDDKLDAICNMRSNDVFIGLPHDVFFFTMLQEIIARSLNCELGNYYHNVGSMHIYSDDIDSAKLFVNEGYMSQKAIMTPMPNEQMFENIKSYLRTEKLYRNGNFIDVSEVSNTSYWQDLLNLIKYFHQSNLNFPYTQPDFHNADYSSFISKRIQYLSRDNENKK